MYIYRKKKKKKRKKEAETTLSETLKDLKVLMNNSKQYNYYYRITESQNSRGWKGPLWVI